MKKNKILQRTVIINTFKNKMLEPHFVTVDCVPFSIQLTKEIHCDSENIHTFTYPRQVIEVSKPKLF